MSSSTTLFSLDPTIDGTAFGNYTQPYLSFDSRGNDSSLNGIGTTMQRRLSPMIESYVPTFISMPPYGTVQPNTPIEASLGLSSDTGSYLLRIGAGEDGQSVRYASALCSQSQLNHAVENNKPHPFFAAAANNELFVTGQQAADVWIDGQLYDWSAQLVQ